MKGYRTILLGALMVIAPPLLTYLAGIKWSDYVSPETAIMISGVIAIGLRVVTTTPIGKSVIIFAIASLAAFGAMVPRAEAGDISGPAAINKAAASTSPSVCSYLSCTGLFAGANVTQIGEQNASVLNLGAVNSSGFYMGANAGYQLLSGNFLLAAKGRVSYEVYAPATDPLAGSGFKDKLFAMESIELGGNLAALFPSVAAAIQLPNWMTPLVTGVEIGGCQHGSKLSGFCMAVSEHYYLPNTKWSFDATVVNAQYGNTNVGTATNAVNTSTETRVDAGITYHF